MRAHVREAMSAARPSSSAERMRRHRERQRAGLAVVTITVATDTIDALEKAGFAPAGGIVSPKSLAAAIEAYLAQCATTMKRRSFQ